MIDNTKHKASFFQKMRLLTNSNNINTLKLLIAGDLAGQKLEVSYVPPGKEARYTPGILLQPSSIAAVNIKLQNPCNVLQSATQKKNVIFYHLAKSLGNFT